ncbi:RHS repeat-associated core domain-containing protein [Phytohabitans suffuscus]
MSVLLAVTLTGQPPASAEPAPTPFTGEAAQRYKPVRGADAKPATLPADTTAAANLARPAPVWPKAGTAVVTLPTTAARSAAIGGVKAGSLPVQISAPVTEAAAKAAVPAKVKVDLLSEVQARTVGVNGLLLRVGRADGGTGAATVNVRVDYTAFRHAYGADWASRLRLVQLPGCALTGASTACAPEPLASRNNVRAGTVDADVAATSETLMALMAGPSGGTGDFKASSLASSSSWAHGGNTGGFTWSYPMRSPPAAGGPAPSIGLSYASQSVDGRSAATNNQPGPIGEGFGFEPGFIERRFKSCADDMDTPNANNSSHETGDLCWVTTNGNLVENATLSLGGASVELLKGSDGKWHPRKEDGSKVELLTTPAYGNGDNNNEFWKVTTADGTQYWFGRHQLPGWSSGRPTTNSVLTVPVFGNNPGEDCYTSSFATAHCDQAWRWNLDYVQDVHGNTMSLWWARETNYYAQNVATASPVDYHRGGHLLRIDYGSDNRDNNEYAAAAPYVENTPARVDFTNVDRCLSNCGTKDETTWPDTPWDQECTATTNPCLNGSPTFWSSKRLTVITTKVWKAATSSYQPVDSWTLRHSFPDPGDGTRAGLWLEGITQRGLNGTTITMPEVTFEGIQMQNRVDDDGADWALAMNWWRVNSIRTETGSEIFVTYSGPQCVADTNVPSPTALDNNRMRCYPVKWTPPTYDDPVLDYFHKYVVDEVQQIDHTGGAETLLTRYQYLNPDNLPLWHHNDDDGLTPDDRLTWGQWRGYPIVVTRVGEGADETRTETLYFRGMHGDKLASGGTRTATVQGIEGGAATDYDHYAGIPREQITWLGTSVLSAAVNEPWRSDPPTATRSGTPVAEARYARIRTVKTRNALDGVNNWRRTTATTTYDSYGMPTTVDDRGDDATATDDRCVVTEYARNITNPAWLLSPVKRVHGWADDCATPPTAANQVTTDTKFTLDNLAYGAAPTKGAITKVETIKDWNGGTRLYQTTATTVYDAQGRVKSVTDIAGETTTTDYTPAAGGPVTQTVTTNPLLWTDTVELDPAWGTPTKATDPNLRVTEATYDALGRTTGVWLPGRGKASFPNAPSSGYSYSVSKTVPSVITTRAVNPNGGYNTTYEYLDALGRPRQTQTPAYGGGRVITDLFYDSAGRVWKANGEYTDPGTAGTSLFNGFDVDMPSQTRTLFDAAGRPTDSILFTSVASAQVEKWRTTTSYHGDHVNTTPPVGGTATTVWVDARGNTSKLWQYHGGTPTGSYDETRYTYHPTGNLATVTDPAGNTWSYDYDIQGRQTQVDDPDSGVSTMTYNAYGDLETVSDARPGVPDLAYTYDDLGRPTTVREGTITGTKRAEWVYDTPAKGMVKSASRWIGTDEYKTETVTVDALYRPTQTRVIIPVAEGSLAGTYTFRASFLADGSPNTMIFPAAGGLNQETLTYKYDTVHAMPNMLTTNYPGVSHYVIDASYTNAFEAATTTRSTALTGAPLLQTTQRYDEAAGRVDQRKVLKTVGAATISDANYEYDPAGNIIKIDDIAGTRDTQCFNYDHQRRLTRAWTPTSANCGTVPTTAGLGGPAPYWHDWSFGTATDPAGRVGNRLSQTEHATAGDTTTTYTYPAAGSDRPHAVTGYTRTGPGGTTTGAYTYDPAGNTLTRPGPNSQQTLTWDPEGHLATLTDTAGANSYVYDANGNRLISKDPTGATLHLGGTELRLTTATGQVSATRYYTFNGETVAQRTPSGLTWLAADHQGTNQLAITADTTQTVTWRRQTPYGNPRGSTPTWPNKLGFVGGYKDTTGLTHLGAREYDPQTGRFISVDPILDTGNPQHLNAYAYAGNSPVTISDPSGLIAPEYNDPGNDEGGNPCGGDYFGYACEKHVQETNPYDGPAVNMGNVHGMLDACGLVVPVIGAGCDVGNGVIYFSEGDAVGGAVSIVSVVPGLDWACKIKSLCKRIGEGAVNKAKKLFGKPPAGGPKTTSTDVVEEIAKEKAYDRARPVKPTAPDPKKPPALGPKGGPAGPGPAPAKSSCKHSFDPATPVLKADGTTKPIADIEEGEQVLAHDPETGTTQPQPVTALHTNQDTDLTDLTIRTRDGQATLYTTQHHPFWNETVQKWTDAAQLKHGDQLRTTIGEATVTEVRNYTRTRTMRDLTVGTIHTYYVVAGNTPVLVHNCGGEATVHLNPEEKHALITVRSDAGEVLSTHQFGGPRTAANGVATFDPADLPASTINVPIRLPNAGGAMAYSEVMMDKTARGVYPAYSLRTQSCVTYCANVLRAGGVEGVPTTPLEAQRWFFEQLG